MTRVAIIGAGPYGLSIAAHLRSLGVPHRIFGTPIDTWLRHMPAGMSLKSDGFASSLSSPEPGSRLSAYCAENGIAYDDTAIPVELDVFTTYAVDFQKRFVPQVEDRQVIALDKGAEGFTLKLDDGETLTADLVVAAVGITHFARMPQELSGLPANLVSHASDHHDLSAFAGRDVTVIGAGSSAVDIAALLAEAGANTSLVARRDRIKFASAQPPGGRSLYQRLRHPSTGIGPGLRSWIFQKRPNLFRFLPGGLRVKIIRRHLGPSSAWWMKPRFEAGVSTTLNAVIEQATVDGGQARLVLRTPDGPIEHRTDHVIAATGYWPDVERLEFFSDSLRSAIRTHEKMPVLSGGFESSVRGLYFVGPPAANSFGPLMRFMVGAEYVAPRVARVLARRAAATR
ncbi:MAG: NAD(P)/FAD-dependent oxidoreductase [Hamadaea sp.]|nr:NAD(P)/FAD-dependent oxidoreductase [Hamadaea sp.]NUT07083.1 NAD(P)/FAD-dependent oxidoreductase [Hamadaea sp.]